ncbi:MAG: magnesium transporter [Lachnospiraceae bacterium]|nr:magnesium transporter [Lachnospiraceae bacterium]
MEKFGVCNRMTILDIEEFKNRKEEFPRFEELLHGLGSIRYCKAEVYEHFLVGTLRIPQKNEQRRPLFSFAFYMTKQELFLIEDTGDIRRFAKKMEKRIQSTTTPDQSLLLIMELMIENDILYLSHLEKEMEDMEEELSHGIPHDFFQRLTGYRRKLSELNAYYEQLGGIGDLMQAHHSLVAEQNEEQWERFDHRTERLQNHVRFLRENVIQLRELYQSKQDAQQNKIMCILTVVTTLFLPLTLLTGWYGMNFAYMPELHWKYGYLAVFLLAVLIVTMEIVYYKKKKIL